MAKSKKKAAPEGEESILDVLGIGGDAPKKEPAAPGTPEPNTDDRITALLGTIEGLAGRVDQMQGDFMRLASGGAAPITAPEAPKLAEVTFDGLPDQTDDPEGFTKGLNSRVNETLRANMAALTAHQAAQQAAVAAGSARGDQLWSDFQDSYFDKLEVGLPDTIKDVTPYVETAAKAVAARAVRGVSDPAQKARVLDNLMYGSPQRFMEDVFNEAELVLAPLRPPPGEGEGEGGEGPTPEELTAHRTGGIDAPASRKGKGEKGEGEGGSMVEDIQEIQRATGFY